MWRLVRSMLMWLLALALPLQGVSAATMVACGIDQHDHSQTVLLHSATADPAATHVHGQAGHHVHEHLAAAPEATKTKPAHDAAHKCSVCAACCLGAAMPPAIVSLASVDMTDLVGAFVARTLPAFVTEGLERPPRTFLA